MSGNIIIGSILGWVAFSICSVLTGVIYSLLCRITKLEKTVTDQQDQIADLKRELEEGKGKQSEPQS